MKKLMHYPKAPIIEAVLALQVLPCEGFNKSFYEDIKSELSKGYTSKDIDEMLLEFHIGEDQQNNSQSKKKVGIRLESPDGRYVIQARENGYAFSILNYYDRWETFSKDAYKYWNVYKRIFKPQKVVRQALRYINRIDIPETSFELKEYFKVYPHLFDDDINVKVAGFVMQAQIPLPQKEGGVANITQTVVQPTKPGCSSILLDIDVFDNKHFKPGTKGLKDRIEILRDQKNFVFKSSITDKTEILIS
ncbi:MAG: TIGR04255 family protein [Pseudomonadota bacterium]|nr:TIGR04255 family protein [Pseudomonadota bacterium]MDE3037208.1 TIGR04255 family protein [Pseudomonadota bacterium]